MKKILKFTAAVAGMAVAYWVGRNYSDKVEETALSLKDGAIDLKDKASDAAKSAWQSIKSKEN